MGWDEALFGWLYRKVRAVRRDDDGASTRAATLEPLRERLRLVASALAERPIEIRAAEGEGGWRGDTIVLPSRIDLMPSLEENADAYVCRVAWAVSARSLGLALSVEGDDRLLATALAAAATRRAMLAELPSLEERWTALERRARTALGALDAPLGRLLAARLGDHDALAGTLGRERAWLDEALACEPSDVCSLAASVAALAPGLRALRSRPLRPPAPWGWVGSVPDPKESTESAPHGAEALPSGSEIRARPRETPRRKDLRDDPADDNPLVHTFEKVHTAEEHRGGQKSRDGSDELADHAEALDELDLREVVRTTDRTASLLRCDAMFEGTAGDLVDTEEDVGLPYDEWHERERRYRPAWCRVRVQPVPATADAGALVADLLRRTSARTDAVRAELLRIEHARRWRNRQLDGPEIDDDAVVDRLAALAGGHTGPERLYRARRPHAPELAAVLLLDASLSTDGWIADRRVLDVELEAAMTIAEALDDAEVELGVATFHSHTRRDCRFSIVKGMRERWTEVRPRVGAIKPAGYTRIGPALRHATTILARSDARRRLLLVLTDGKPNDYDRYEGSYGIADVRQAVREAEQRRIHVHALAFDPEAKIHLPRMFGGARYDVVADPDRLALAVGGVFGAMSR